MIVVCNLILAIFCLGFFFHTSGGENLFVGKYSPTYTYFLLAIASFWIVGCWWIRRKRQQLGSIVASTAGVFGITLLLALLVLPGVYIYFHQRALESQVFPTIDPESHSFFQIEKAPDYPRRLPEETIKILALGGSTTYGAGLERNETFPALLEKILSKRLPENRFSVLNAGVPWHTSMHSLLRYIARYSDWKPDIMIVMHAFNDIFQASEGQLTSGKFRDDYGHFFGAMGQRVNPKDKFSDGIGKFISNNWFARTWYSDLEAVRERKQKPVVDLLKALPTFRRNMGELVRRGKQDGAVVIVATQPYLYRDKMPEFEKKKFFYDYYYKDYAVVPALQQQRAAMDRFNTASKEITENNRSLLVDVEAKLPKSIDFMYDDVHYTNQGAERVARIIAESIDWNSIIGDR